MEKSSIDSSALELLKILQIYIKEYSYSIEYFFEGYAIFFYELHDKTHLITIFYDINIYQYAIQSKYNNLIAFHYENITNIQELTPIALKLFLRLDLIENLLKK